MNKSTETLQVTKPADREITITRVFDAPRRAVFDAMTKPESLKRWFGPQDWSLAVCEVDFKVGGTFRYRFRSADGGEFGMRGDYREIVPYERIVHAESYDMLDWPELIVTTEYLEQGGKTTLTCTVLHSTKEICAANSQMQAGVADVYDKLANYLASLA